MSIRLVAIAAPDTGLVLEPSASARPPRVLCGGAREELLAAGLAAFKAEYERDPSAPRETPTAVVEVNGPLVSGDGCWWGGVSIPVLAKRIEELAESGMGILLDFDSPGGDVSGLVELCDVIAVARQRVSVKAYVRGLCASAAYWVATQCESIECSPTAIVGQIGAQVVIYDPPAADEYHGVRVVITSTGSERKNAAASEDGAQYQALVDNTAAEFVAAVARGRGVAEDVVRGQFGHGALLPAPEALRLGMIDAVRVAAGGGEMAKLKAEDMAAPAGPATLEDALKLIEELQRQLADKTAEMETMCKPDTEAGTDVPDSPVDPELDPEKEALKAELVAAKMTAEVSTLIANGILPPGRRAEVEKAYRLEMTAKADARLAEFATAYTDLVAQLKKSAPVHVRSSVSAPAPAAEMSVHDRIMAACGGDRTKYSETYDKLAKEGVI